MSATDPASIGEAIAREMAASATAEPAPPAPPAVDPWELVVATQRLLIERLQTPITPPPAAPAPPAEPEPEPEPARPWPGSGAAPQPDLSGVIDPRSLTGADIARLRANGELIPTLERWRNANRPGTQVWGRRRG